MMNFHRLVYDIRQDGFEYGCNDFRAEEKNDVDGIVELDNAGAPRHLSNWSCGLSVIEIEFSCNVTRPSHFVRLASHSALITFCRWMEDVLRLWYLSIGIHNFSSAFLTPTW